MNFSLVMLLINSLSSIINLAIFIIFIRAFLQFKRNYKIFNYVSIFFAAIINVFVLTIIKEPVFMLIANILIYSLLSVLLVKGRMLSKLFSGLLVTFIGVLTESVTVVILRILLKLNFSDIENNIGYYLLGVFVSKLILFTLVKLFIYFKMSKVHNIPRFSWFLMLFIPLLSSQIAYEVAINVKNFSSLDDIFAILSLVSILFINIIVFTLFEAIVEQNELKEKYKLADQQLIFQRIHYNELTENYKVTRGMWHDMNNHINIIKSLMQSGNIEKAEKYLDAISEAINHNPRMLNTGNPEMDALITYKKRYAEKLGIELDLKIQVPEKLNVEPLDLCIIMGNALDNAIEASNAEEILATDKKINSEIKFIGNYLCITISNPYNGKLNHEEGRFISIKKNSKNHGFGILNIERAVKKYNGNVKINFRDNLFVVNMILDCSENIES